MQQISVQHAATGQTIVSDYPEFIYPGLLQQPFELIGGTRYWVSIVNPPAYTWAWEGADRGGDAFVQVNGGPWTLERSVGGAFALSTDIPESGSAMLLTIGLMSLVIAGGRSEAGRQRVHTESTGRDFCG